MHLEAEHLSKLHGCHRRVLREILTQLAGNDHNKPHSLMSDPISTMYFHNMFCDLLNKILFKPTSR